MWLTYLIISFIAIIILAIEDYEKDKKLNLRDHYLKYAVCLAFGLFALSNLLKWQIFLYVLMGAGVYVLGHFWSWITLKLGIKKPLNGAK